MVGRYLATLTPKQEDAVLTERLGEAPMCVRADGCRCLVGVIEDWRGTSFPRDLDAMIVRSQGPFRLAGVRFDSLCKRFGEVRINAAIRNRILANIARRELSGVRDMSVV